MKKNKFIVFEGIDGSGKSTIVNKLYDFIKDKSLPVVKLYEPTKESSYGKKIRELARENISIAYNVTTLDFGVKGGVNLFDKPVSIEMGKK